MVAAENDCYAVDVRDGAKLVINGGTFNGNISAVYVREGSVHIAGGEFMIQQPLAESWAADPEECLINAYDAAYADGSASIVVTGGSFHGFDPANCNDDNLVPAGFSSLEDNDIWTVSANENA